MSSNNPPPQKQQAADTPTSSSPRIRQAAFMPPRSPSSMASPPPPQSPSSSAVADAIPESQDDAADLPLTMTASVILTGLPGDAKKALEKAASGGDAPAKVTIYFHPLRDAPGLKQSRFKISATQPFGAVVSFLRKKLKVREGDSIWCYIDNFAPAPDEGVGGLFACFKRGEELKVGYSITPTFG